MAVTGEMSEKVHPLEDIVEDIASENSSNLLRKLKKQFSFTMKRTHSAFFFDRQESESSVLSEVDDEDVKIRRQKDRPQVTKGRSEEGQGSYQSPLERCIISREKRLRRRMSFDNFSNYLNK